MFEGGFSVFLYAYDVEAKNPNTASYIIVRCRGSMMTSELGKRILLIVAKRGYTGADREVLFHNIRGIRYIQLEEEILSLENGGFITVEWVGPSNFTVSITPEGVELAKSYQEDIWRKDTAALRELKRMKHEEKSIVHEEVGYSKMIEEKMHVEEVGNLSTEILDGMEGQIISEKVASIEPPPASFVAPAVEEIMENEAVESETEAVERRISGELVSEEAGDGETIAVEYSDEEEYSEDRIAVDEVTSLEKRTKEKRISGEIEGDIGEEKPKKAKVKKRKKKASNSEETEALPQPVEESNQDIFTTDFYRQIEDAIAFGESLQQESEVNPITNPNDMNCVWEMNRECSILKSREWGLETNLTPYHCVVCQLLEIKRLLKK